MNGMMNSTMDGMGLWMIMGGLIIVALVIVVLKLLK